ncbi:hypothetical protein Cgig2_032211 [Carnegiea gigantea]|uniref:Uncharacterized protein n=1 Tax=Carnegiea gigantea TaxID=171969 RepID=A0A9Q1K4R0_9CARY|nr:hypothetical protein Cgig2_032211 [Carnegiea gigantea]
MVKQGNDRNSHSMLLSSENEATRDRGGLLTAGNGGLSTAGNPGPPPKPLPFFLRYAREYQPMLCAPPARSRCYVVYRHCKARQSSVVKDKRDKQQKDKRLILTMEDLSKALREFKTKERAKINLPCPKGMSTGSFSSTSTLCQPARRLFKGQDTNPDGQCMWTLGTTECLALDAMLGGKTGASREQYIQVAERRLPFMQNNVSRGHVSPLATFLGQLQGGFDCLLAVNRHRVKRHAHWLEGFSRDKALLFMMRNVCGCPEWMQGLTTEVMLREEASLCPSHAAMPPTG